MSAFTEKNGITRRTALELMTTSAIGLNMMGATLTVSEAADDLNSTLRKALPKFRDESLAFLRRSLEDPAFRGAISAKDSATLCKNENLSVDDLMLALLPLAKELRSRADFQLLCRRGCARGERKSLSGLERRDSRPVPGIRGAWRAIGAVEGVHEFRGVCPGAGGDRRRTLRTLPAIHGGNLARWRDVDPGAEQAPGQAVIDLARRLRARGTRSEARRIADSKTKLVLNDSGPDALATAAL